MAETTFRPINHRQAAKQIGAMTVMAICGGRMGVGPEILELKCGNGYRVEIQLAANDTYTVRRVFVRSGKRFVKGEVSDVYCDQLSETAYRAGMFRDEWPEGGAV